MPGHLFPHDKEKAGPAIEERLPDGFVMLAWLLPDAVTDMRYAGSCNFMGTPVEGYEAPAAILTLEAAAALKKADDRLKARGFRIKVLDAYRPRRAVKHFLRWSQDLQDTATKMQYYPELEKSRLVAEHYIAPNSSHSRGSTVDVTLFDCSLNCDADMGSPFDFFSECSHAAYTATLSPAQIAHRRLLRRTMLDCGFLPLETEWWHFSLADEPFPETVFDFPVKVYPEK
ncbi:MAG: M15 family metallopeptidase [Lentisphaeria bacterium]|nr:M15 family metallopeptidase [Lentisphaeria bacterium]